MIVGVGIDIVELKRIQKSMENPRFIERILTAGERDVFMTLTDKRKIEFLGGRFAVKEAYSKAIGTGIGKELSFLDMEVVNDQLGKPVLRVETPHVVHLSLSHSEHYAVANVIIESLSS